MAAGNASVNTAFSSPAGFRITYPSAWQAQTSSNASTPVRIFIYLPAGNAIDGIIVAEYPLTSTATLDSFISYNLAQIQQEHYTDYQLLLTNASVIVNQPAHKVVWQAEVPVTIKSAPAQNTPAKVMQIFTINKEKLLGYIITYKTIPSDYDIYMRKRNR